MQLTQIIGNKVRVLREREGLTQDDVARAARKQGLPWRRTTVAHLEAGTKVLTAEEFVAMPLLFAEAFDELVGLPAIVSPSDDSWIDLTSETRVEPGALAALLSGETPGALSAATLDTPQIRNEAAFGWLREMAPDEVKAIVKRALARRRGVLVEEQRQVRQESEGEAERKAASRLGVPALDVAFAARRLWKRSLTEERNARVAELAEAEATARSVQALRGHVTRSLLAELGSALAEES